MGRWEPQGVGQCCPWGAGPSLGFCQGAGSKVALEGTAHGLRQCANHSQKIQTVSLLPKEHPRVGGPEPGQKCGT